MGDGNKTIPTLRVLDLDFGILWAPEVCLNYHFKDLFRETGVDTQLCLA